MPHVYNRNTVRCGLLLLIMLTLPFVPAVPCAQPLLAGINRATLIAEGPGGSVMLPSIHPADGQLEFRFLVALDAQLGSQDYEDYLLERSAALSMKYEVLVSEDSEEGGPGKLLLQIPAEAGVGRLSADRLTAGALYSWVVQASGVDENGNGIQLSSSPLFFRIAGPGQLGGGLFGTSTDRTLLELRTLLLSQLRAQAALSAELEGLRMYANYPVATDQYVSTSIGDHEFAPLPDFPSELSPPVSQLARVGSLLNLAVVTRQQIREGAEAQAACFALSEMLSSEAGALLGEAHNPPQGLYDSFESILLRIDPALQSIDAESAVGAISELIILLDKIAGSGSFAADVDYQTQFAMFAEASQERLRSLEQMRVPFEAIVGEQETAAWLTRLELQRAKLALLADEVAAGRLSKRQLAQRISEGRAALPVPADLPNVDRARCMLSPGAAAQLSALDETGRLGIARQLLICHLERLENSVWAVE